MSRQADLDIAQALSIGQLRKRHRSVLLGAAKRSHPSVATVARNNPCESAPAAAGRFELDFWSAAGTEAVRRLEQRLKTDPMLAAASLPRVITCIPWREYDMGKVYPQGWIVETDPSKAQFLIETERYRCAQGRDATLIDEVKRLGQAFAWTYIAKPR